MLVLVVLHSSLTTIVLKNIFSFVRFVILVLEQLKLSVNNPAKSWSHSVLSLVYELLVAKH